MYKATLVCVWKGNEKNIKGKDTRKSKLEEQRLKNVKDKHTKK